MIQIEQEKDIEEKRKTFLFKLKVFLWFLGTEPFRQLKQIWYIILNIIEALNKTITWSYIAIILIVVSLFFGKKFMAGVFLAFLLLVLLLWEWERGFFMYRYRQKTREKNRMEEKNNE